MTLTIKTRPRFSTLCPRPDYCAIQELVFSLAVGAGRFNYFHLSGLADKLVGAGEYDLIVQNQGMVMTRN